MRTPFADSPEFRRLLDHEPGVDLARVALEIAGDAYPGLDIEGYLRRIDDLATRVRQRCPTAAKPRAILEQVNWLLFVEEGFHGDRDDYYDPRNSYLNEVMDRRTGIPISLAVLYRAVAAPLGLDLAGVNLPGHFVLTLAGSDPPLFVDAFHSGRMLDGADCSGLVAAVMGGPVGLTPAHLAAATPAAVVTRMLRNLERNYLRVDDLASALPVSRRLAALNPDDSQAQRDWGVLAARTGHAGESILPLAAYLDRHPDADDAAVVAEILRSARRDVAAMN